MTFQVDLLTDIALAQPGQLCARCGGTLEATRGVEVGPHLQAGHLLQRGPWAQNYLDAEGPEPPHHHGLLRHRRRAAAGRRHRAEPRRQRHRLPPTPSPPYQGPPRRPSTSPTKDVAQAAEDLYAQLNAANIENPLRRPHRRCSRSQVQRRRPHGPPRPPGNQPPQPQQRRSRNPGPPGRRSHNSPPGRGGGGGAGPAGGGIVVGKK